MDLRVPLVAIAMAACAHAYPLALTIGPAHELLVPVVVNGQQLVLQVDTGASTTTLTPSARDRLHLHANGSSAAAGAAGPIAGVERMRLDMTEIANLHVTGLHAAVIDLDNAGVSDGLLGMDVLRVEIADIDLAKNRFVLYSRGDTGWRTPDLVALPYTELENGQIELAIVIDGRPAAAILDLGANQSFANRLAAPTRDATVRVLTAIVGADGHPWQFRAFGDIALRVGGVPLVASTLLVGDLPIFGELGLASRPTVIIGTDLLATHRVVIDPGHHRVYLSTTPSGAPPRAAPARLRLVRGRARDRTRTCRPATEPCRRARYSCSQ